MEDIKEYIESGILELYVLGDLRAGERLQVEDMASKYLAVKAEIDEIEKSMEFYAEAHAVEPSEKLRTKILNSLVINLADDNNYKGKTRPGDDDYDKEENVIPLPTRKVNSFYKYAFAACLTLLLISIYGLVNLYSRLQDSNTQLTALQQDKQHFANQVNMLDSELDMYRDPAFKVLKLQGTPKTPNSTMTLAWNSVNKKVTIAMKGMKLPTHDNKHQYQLWALVGGKPVDMGIFDAPPIDTIGVKEMKAIASADAFAVTLEPTGGSTNPTLDQMVVIGKF